MLGKTLRPLMVLGALLATAPASAQIQLFLENFDARSLNTEVMFQEPRFSGSTEATLEATPNASLVSDVRAFSGTQSLRVAWQWAAGPNPWLRLTTFNTGILPNPTIPITDGYVEFKVFVDGPAALRFTLGVRETNPTGALGSNGGTAGSIEWIGSSTFGSAPGGKTITAGSWQTLGYFVDSELVGSFTGNGILTTTTGKAALECLAITPADTAQRGPYVLFIDDVFFTFNPRRLTGTITLEDCTTPTPVPIEFRSTNANDPVFTRTVLPDANGDFEVVVPAGNYHVGVKHPNFLRVVVPNVDLTSDATLPSVLLRGGDADDSNTVDVLDLDLLIQSFDTCEGDEGFIAGADFNCDGCADVLDLDVLIRNFDQAGDDFPGGD